MIKDLKRQEDGRRAFLAIDGPRKGEFIFSYTPIMEYIEEDSLESSDNREGAPSKRHQYICNFYTGKATYNAAI